MNTTEAIQVLIALKQTLDSSVSGLQAQSNAIDVALKQLQGILDTPTADLVAAQAEVTKLLDKLDAKPIDKNSVDALDIAA